MLDHIEDDEDGATKDVKRMSNVEFIKSQLCKQMEFSNNGPVFQAFVIEALASYSEQVLNAPAGTFGDDNSIIPAFMWRNCAQELADLMATKYPRG